MPVANPIGLAHQHLFADQIGRFDTASRVESNRGYPQFNRANIGLLDAGRPWTGAVALMRWLLTLALPHAIVLDLHCDDEAVPLPLHARRALASRAGPRRRGTG